KQLHTSQLFCPVPIHCQLALNPIGVDWEIGFKSEEWAMMVATLALAPSRLTDCAMLSWKWKPKQIKTKSAFNLILVETDFWRKVYKDVYEETVSGGHPFSRWLIKSIRASKVAVAFNSAALIKRFLFPALFSHTCGTS